MRNIVVAVTLAAAGSVARADLVADTFLPGGDFTHNTYLEWAPEPPTARIGYRFTASASGGLTDLTAAVYRTVGAPVTDVRFELFGDAGGLPGAVLGTWASPDVPTYTVNPSLPALHLALDGTVPVVQGQTYYFVVSHTGPSTALRWFVGSPTNMGVQVYQPIPGPWTTESQPYGAFRLQTAPAPASVLPLLGILGVQFRRKRGTTAIVAGPLDR